ncbi:MAG: hypothetical protein QXT14_07725 [Candidatus Bathyarchaeia archaeon]
MALLMCSIFVITSFILLGFGIQMDLVKPQLLEVAEYTASTIVDLVTLANQTDAQPLTLVKELKIPPSVAERGFTINLTSQGKHAYVRVYLTFLTPVAVEAPINLNSSQEAIIVSSTEKASPEVNKYLSERNVLIKNVLYSGLEHPVVWCVKDSKGVIYIGLGVWTGGVSYSETFSPVAFLKYETKVNEYMYYVKVVEICML